MKRLLIVGAGGHGRVAAEIARLCDYNIIGFLDDDRTRENVVDSVSAFQNYIGQAAFFVAIGNSDVRCRIMTELMQNGAEVVSLIHPAAVIADKAVIGTGVMVAAGAVVNVNAVIEDGVIINTAASVDHDCKVGAYSHISVGAHVCGTVNIGAHTWIGAGATVINDLTICDRGMVGAGAVVDRDITASGTYRGVPAQ